MFGCRYLYILRVPNNTMENNKIKCPNCKKTNIVKRGSFETKAHGKQQRYFCKDCNKKFIEQTPFYRMRNTPQKITLCLDLFYKGVSTRKVQEHLQAFYPHNSSHKSIYKWVVKYSKLIHKKVDKLKITASEEIQIDEMEYKTRGKKSWFIDTIDVETRFMVSSNFTEKREQVELKRVLFNAKNKTGTQIKICTSDGYTAYPNAIKRVWGYDNKKGKHNVRHNKVNASRGEGFNHKVERMHNSIRQRTKIFRGFHGSFESANAIMKGYEVFYNFIRKHQAINCCPYELACPQLKDKLNVPNKWLALIEMK